MIIYVYIYIYAPSKPLAGQEGARTLFHHRKASLRMGLCWLSHRATPLWTSKVKSTMIPTAMRMKTMLIHPRGQSLRERVPMLPWLELNRPRLWIPWARPMLCSKAWASMWWWRRIRRRSCMTSSSRSMSWRSDPRFFKNIWKDRG